MTGFDSSKESNKIWLWIVNGLFTALLLLVTYSLNNFKSSITDLQTEIKEVNQNLSTVVNDLKTRTVSLEKTYVTQKDLKELWDAIQNLKENEIKNQANVPTYVSEKLNLLSGQVNDLQQKVAVLTNLMLEKKETDKTQVLK